MGTVGFDFAALSSVFSTIGTLFFLMITCLIMSSSCCREYDIKCIIDLHAAPGSQNGMEHSSSRDGFTGWPTSPDYISESLHVIDFLVSRYFLNVQTYSEIAFILLTDPILPG